MPLQPSRRDTIGPPPRDVSDLAALVRHHESAIGQVEPGLLGGTRRTPRPVRPTPSQIVGDGGGDGDSTGTPWEWGDRMAVVAVGTQSFRLTYEPVEESLFLYWHPDGKAPIKQTNEHWSLDGQIVTILDPGGDIQPGDMFSAQYQYEPTEIVDGPLTLIGTGQLYANNPTLALPPGTQVGDFIVITTITGTVSDPRVSLLADHNGTGLAHFYSYAGTITSLGDFAASGGMTLASWAVFRAPQVVQSPAPVVGPSSAAFALPSVAAPHAIVVGGSRNGLVGSTMTLPAGYSAAVDNALLFGARGLIAYWDASADEASPSGSVSGDFDDYMVNVLGLTNEDLDS